MQKKLNLIGLLMLIIFLPACKTTLTTVKASSVHSYIRVDKIINYLNYSPLDNVYIIINIKDIPIKYSTESVSQIIKTKIEEELSIRSIKTEVIIYNLNIVDDKIKNDIKQYGTNIVITVDLRNESMLNDLGKQYLAGGDLIFSVNDFVQNKEIWKVAVSLERKYIRKGVYYPSTVGTFKSAIEMIIDSLDADKMFKELKTIKIL